MRRRSSLVEARVPMWVVDHRFWTEHIDVPAPERWRLHAAAADEWMEQHGDRPGLDPFSDEGAFELEAAEAAIRTGDRW